MKKYTHILLLSLLALLVASCSSNDIPDDGKIDDKNSIEIRFNSDNFSVVHTSTKSAQLRATDDGSEAERKIENINLFLFDETDASKSVSYYFASNGFEGVTWTNQDGKGNITLSMKQEVAGTRLVYIVANYGSKITATSVDDLKAIKKESDTPWSPTLTTPIIMEGSANHDFIANRVLGGTTATNIKLTRALAKIELNIDLEKSFQSPVSNVDGKTSAYQYRFVNFDKETYVLNPETKTEDDLKTSHDNLATTWFNWTYDDITVTNGVATHLRLSTYLNERFKPGDNASIEDKLKGAYIEIRMHYNDGGLLPPPEFAPETYTFPTFDKVERNYKYVFDTSISAKEE